MHLLFLFRYYFRKIEKSIKFFLKALALLSLLGTGCTGQKPANAANAPQIQFHLTDFPIGNADVTSVIITVLRIEVMQQDETWITAMDYGTAGLPIDLLQYQNGLTLQVGNFTVAAGDYKQMRFVISSDITVVENTTLGSTTITINTPSESYQYIKILDDFHVGNDHHASIIIDFDVQHSLHMEGNHYFLTPMVHLKEVSSDDTSITLTPVSIPAQYLQPAPPLNSTVSTTLSTEGLIALNSIMIGAGSQVSGNISVLGTCLTISQTTCSDASDCDEKALKACLDGAGEINFGTGTNQTAGYLTSGNRVQIGANAIINGLVTANFITLDATALSPNQNIPLVSVPALPEFFTGYKSQTDVGAANSPLAEGIYGKLTLNDNESIILSGGNYHFKKIVLGNNTSITCTETCTLYDKGSLTAGNNVIIRSDIDSPNAFYIYLGKHGETNGNHSSSQNLNNGYYTSSEVTNNDSDIDEYEVDSRGPLYFSTGTGAQIKGNFYAPFGVFQLGDQSAFNGMMIARKIAVGLNCSIIGTPPSIILSQNYVAQANYNGSALQLDFIDNANAKMIDSTNPSYVFHGTYTYNISTRIININYQTVDLIDPNCLSCQATGTYPAIATYDAASFDIPKAYWGFEVMHIDSTGITARVISDGTVINFLPRAGFGPYDTLF